MKIGIMTFHWATNYGAVLQAYALQETLKKLGNDAEIINYFPARYKKNIFRALMKIRPKSIFEVVRKIPKERLFEGFRKKYLDTTQYYKSNKTLMQANLDYDCYICGSDQVWNTSFLSGGERKKTYSYFLNFAPNDKIIASYAASFGVTKYMEELKPDLKKILSRFDFISVRENTGLDILKDIGIEDAVVVPDPSILLEKKDYEALFEKSENKNEYVYCYMLHKHEKDADEILKYLQNKDLTIMMCSKESIEKWLSNIYNSSLVVTNSFHGVVFSVLFEKPFVAILMNGSGMNDRIITLLKWLGLENRIYNGDCSILESTIDWEKTRNKLEEYRGVGYNYINKVLNYKKRNNTINCVKKELCSGCQACFNVCPKDAIVMREDVEGFLYPHINKSKCVGCGMCKNICPVLNGYKAYEIGKAFACFNKNEDVRMKSSSGGLFNAISEYVLDKGGVVFGAGFDDKLNVCHQKILDKNEIYKLRGSKYVQSNIGNTYKEVKSFLDDDRLVLFTGTPCQIGGVKKYLQREYDNLVLQDIICHGVPSPAVWRKYLEYQKKSKNSELSVEKMPSFRDKRKGWRKYSIALQFENGLEYCETSGKDLYLQAFINNMSLRPSCYNCNYKSIERESDITLADFWGVWDVIPEMFDDKGTSLVIVNSQKGQTILNELKDRVFAREVSVEDAINYNKSACMSAKKPKNRKIFMGMIHDEQFDRMVLKCLKKKGLKKIIRIKTQLKKIMKG